MRSVAGEIISRVPFDAGTPRVASMYDYLLGGVENFPSDRDAVRQLLDLAPSSTAVAAASRAFLERAVETLVQEREVRQFIVLGAGLPTERGVHEIARQALHGAPDAVRRGRPCRVVYVDDDRMVVSTLRSRLRDFHLDGVAVVDAGLDEIDAVFAYAREELEFLPGEPVAVLMASVLHCLPESAPPEQRSAGTPPRRPEAPDAVRRALHGLAAYDDGYLVLARLVSAYPPIRDEITSLMGKLTDGAWGRVHRAEEVAGFFDGLELLEPGVVDVARWRAAVPQRASRLVELSAFGGVARVRRGAA